MDRLASKSLQPRAAFADKFFMSPAVSQSLCGRNGGEERGSLFTTEIGTSTSAIGSGWRHGRRLSESCTCV